MGAHANYYWIIHYLVELKEELRRVEKAKYKPLIKELSSYEIYPHSDNKHIPNHKDLAEKFSWGQGKMNLMLKDLYMELMATLSDYPMLVKNLVHQIHIHIPYDEQNEMSKELRNVIRGEAIFIQMVLPVTPQIGEEISIPFFEHIGKNYRGYVHSIRHEIKGKTQEIYIEVHPSNDYYYKWMKMKEDYEYRTRRRAT